MDDINKFRIFNKLKTVNRATSVENRSESSAEHSWSCLILADFFLSKTNLELDRLKIYELLMYHDVVEIEAGDTPLHPLNNNTTKLKREQKAVEILKKTLPEPLNYKFAELFEEFEETKTLESKFAKAIDCFDAIINQMDHKKDWKFWTRKFIEEKKLKTIQEFPELEEKFYELLDYLDKNNYFNN